MTTSKKYNELIVIILILLISSVAGCTSTSTPKDSPNTHISVKSAYNMIENNYSDFPNLTYYLDWKIVNIDGDAHSIKDINIGKCDGWGFTFKGIIILDNTYKEVTTRKIISFKKNVPTYPLDRYNQLSPYETIILRANTIPVENLTKVRDHFLNISIDIESINDSTWAGQHAFSARGNIPSDYVVTHIHIRLDANLTGHYHGVNGGVDGIYTEGKATWFFEWGSHCKAEYSDPCPHTDRVIVDATTGDAQKIR